MGKRTRRGKKELDKIDSYMNLVTKIITNYGHTVSGIREICKRYTRENANSNVDLNNNEAAPEDQEQQQHPIEHTLQVQEFRRYPEFNRYKTLILKVTKNDKIAVKWLRKNGFLAKERENCPECIKEGRRGMLKYYENGPESKKRNKGGMYLQCCGEGARCNKRISPFHNTFFDGDKCRIPCSKVLELVYMFTEKKYVTKAAKEVDVSVGTAIDYFNFCREVCAVATERRGDHVIGGVGFTVEIDERKFFCRKYGRGRILVSQQDGWVFGGICRETKDVFMVIVPDRTRITLYHYIKKHILPGTTIMSDEWRAYATLEDEGYEHHTICHKRNFVDPEDPNIHTQNIECQWRYAKKNYPANSTRNDLKESYLQEYLYRKKHGKDKMVHQLLEDIKMVYSWKAPKPNEEM